MAPRKETREEVQRRLAQRKGPGWASRHDKPGSAFKMIFIILISIGVAAGLMWLVFSPSGQPAYVPPAASSTAAPPPDQPAPQAEAVQPASPAKQAQPAAAPLIPIPDDERHFADIIATAAQHYHPGPDATAPADAERQRGQDICQAISSPHVSQWVGTVTALSAGQEHTILAIALDVQTAAASPAPSLPILMLASPPFLPPPGGVNPGETVTFSGDFIPDGTGQDCFQTGGQSAEQALQDPAFVMQLSNVKPTP